MPRVYRAQNGDGVEVRTVSLTTFVACLGLVATLSSGIIGTMYGALHERDAIFRGLATTSDLETMSAGLKQGIDSLDTDIQAHKSKRWHPQCGIEHARGSTERAALRSNIEGLAEDMDRYHVRYRGQAEQHGETEP